MYIYTYIIVGPLPAHKVLSEKRFLLLQYYRWRDDICRDMYVHLHMYTHTHSMSASVWAVRMVEMVVHTSPSSYKLISLLKAHCNIKYAYDDLPIES